MFACFQCQPQGYHSGTTCTQVGPDHPSWNAVVDNYVFIHNAFRNHLDYIIGLSSQQAKGTRAELEKWVSILQAHSSVEDELFMPALESRGFQVPEFIHEGHRRCEEACAKALENVPGPEAQSALLALKDALMQHLEEEEHNIMPAMVDKFSTEELWALDSLIVNPKLGYVDKDMLGKITFWWFGNITSGEGWQLMKNFSMAGSSGKLSRSHWKLLQSQIPVLKDKSLEDVAGDKLLPGEGPGADLISEAAIAAGSAGSATGATAEFRPKDASEAAQAVCRSCRGTGKDFMGKLCTCEAGDKIKQGHGKVEPEVASGASTLLASTSCSKEGLIIVFEQPGAKGPPTFIIFEDVKFGFTLGDVGVGCGCAPTRRATDIVVVKAVERGGQADRLGVKSGWRIKAICDREVIDVEQVQQHLDEFATKRLR